MKDVEDAMETDLGKSPETIGEEPSTASNPSVGKFFFSKALNPTLNENPVLKKLRLPSALAEPLPQLPKDKFYVFV